MANSDASLKLTRQEMYEKVWLTPATKLAQEFGVSDVTIAKICRKHSIPKPPVGYWAKLAHGKESPRSSLPILDDSSLESIIIDPEVGQTQRIVSEEQAERCELEKQPANKIVVGESLVDPHPLIRLTAKSLRGAASDRDHLLHTSGFNCLDVRVGRKSIDRAMRILNAMLKAVEQRGMSVHVENETTKKCFLTCDGVDFSIRLWEKVGKRERALSKTDQRRRDQGEYFSHITMYENYLSGKFTLELTADFGIHRVWYEKGGKLLDNRLNSVVKWLYGAAPRVKERKRQNDEWQREWKLEEERRQREEQRRIRVERRRRQLNAQIKHWQRAKLIRLFVNEVQTKAGSVNQESPLDTWLRWVNAYADAIDPLRDPIDRLPKRHRPNPSYGY